MIEVYIDGASSGHPGISGAGIFIKASGKIYEYTIPLGNMTNHEAEFHAVMKALDICLEKFPGEILSFQSDSQIVVHSIEKNYVKNKQFKHLLIQIMEKASEFPYFFIKWIPGNQNSHADRLAKQAIQMQK